MASFAEYADFDGVGLAELVRNKEVTPADLVDAAIEQIERWNPQVNAVVCELFDRARAQAASGAADGPLAGVPFMLKDLLSALAGEPMTSGSKVYAGWCPQRNTELVDRYLSSGAVIVGKTNTPELGLLPTTEPVLHGPSRNPWDRERTTGGSSGGSGAAVASRMVPLASGGDGGGSIRIPSSCCGLFGLKPTRGRTPIGPVEAESWHGCATEHVLTRSVRDSATMLDCTAGPYLGDQHYLPVPDEKYVDQVGADPGKLRIAFSFDPLLPATVHPDCVAAVEDAAKLLEDLGHRVEQVTPHIDGEAFAHAFFIMVCCQCAASRRAAEEAIGRPARREDFEPRTWLSQELGEAISGGEYLRAISTLQRIAREIHFLLEDYDLILNPTVAEPPPPIGFLDPKGIEAVLEPLIVRLPLVGTLRRTPVLDQAIAETFAFVPWTPVYNATGQPSMSVPLYWNEDNLPIGTMLTGRFGQEALMFRLAAQLEQARPWADQKPPMIR